MYVSNPAWTHPMSDRAKADVRADPSLVKYTSVNLSIMHLHNFAFSRIRIV